MNIAELINSRYTTKSYNQMQKVTREDIEILKEVLHKSPSSINSQPWNFVIVSDPETKARLAEASYFNKQKITDASHLIVFSVISNVTDFETQIQTHLGEGQVNYFNTMLKPLSEAEIKAWLQSQVYIALGMLLSAAMNLKIDSTPMEGIEKDKYKEILKLDKHNPLFAVALGYRNPEDKNQPTITPKKRLPVEMVISEI